MINFLFSDEIFYRLECFDYFLFDPYIITNVQVVDPQLLIDILQYQTTADWSMINYLTDSVFWRHPKLGPSFCHHLTSMDQAQLRLFEHVNLYPQYQMYSVTDLMTQYDLLSFENYQTKLHDLVNQCQIHRSNIEKEKPQLVTDYLRAKELYHFHWVYGAYAFIILTFTI